MPSVLEDKIHLRTPSRKWRLGLIGQRAALVSAIVGVWWLVSLTTPHYILPGPPRVWDSLTLISRNGDLWVNLGITLGRVSVGFLCATLIGLPLGIVFGFGWRVSLVAETLGSSSGVGYRLRQAADLIQTDQVFAWTIALVVMMATLEMGVLRPLENYMFRWKKEAENT